MFKPKMKKNEWGGEITLPEKTKRPAIYNSIGLDGER
jgi:hypothetical protein